jgi:hypothetical protein
MAQTTPEFLVVHGFLDNGFNFVPWLFYSQPVPLSLPETNATYRLVLFDKEGQVLNRATVSALNERCDSLDPLTYVIKGSIALRPHAAQVKLFNEDIVLWQSPVRDAPTLEIVEFKPPENRKVPAQLTLRHSQVFEGAFYNVIYEWAERQSRLISCIAPKATLNLDLANLPGGEKCRVWVQFSNGLRSVQASTDFFEMSLLGPKLRIVSPQEGATLLPGQPLMMQGQVVDAELPGGANSDADLTWWLEEQSTGAGSSACLFAPAAGEHVVRLRYESKSAEVSVKISVKQWEPGMPVPAAQWDGA